MKIATLACVVDCKGGIDKPARGGKLALSTIHFPTRRSRHHSGLDTQRQMALADGRETQQMLAVLANRDRAIFLKLVWSGNPQLGFEKCEVPVRRFEIGLHAGRSNH